MRLLKRNSNRMDIPSDPSGTPFEWNQQRNLLHRLHETGGRQPPISRVVGTDLGELRRAWAQVLGRMAAHLPWFGDHATSLPLVEWKGHGKGSSSWKSYHVTRHAEAWLHTFHPRCLEACGDNPGEYHPDAGTFVMHQWDPTHPAFLRKVIGRTSECHFKGSHWIITAYAYGFPHERLMADHPGLIVPADPLMILEDAQLLLTVVPEFKTTRMVLGVRV